MSLTRTQIVIVGIALVVLIAGGLIFYGVIPGLRSTNTSTLSGSLTVWGVFDTERAMADSLIADFQAANPNVQVTYKRFDVRTYENDLINALAAGTGPDVFMIKNTWLPKHFNKIAPLPATTYTPENLSEAFPSVVSKDFVRNGQVYALPLYVDTLALFYNKDLFDNAGIAQPPKTWAEFEAIIPQLRRIDSAGRITQAAAAIGGSDRNINEATDLLTLVMLQEGVEMTNPQNTQASFFRNSGGVSALEYYTNFARSQRGSYTWEPTLHYSLDAFSEESVAIIFNYAHQIAALEEKNPFLNFGVSPMLQIPGTQREVNYANYWGFAISNTSDAKYLAAPFVMHATTKPEVSVKYLNLTKRPPALRSLIASNINTPNLGIFSRQALTATSWFKADDVLIDDIFSRTIDSVITGQLSANEALKQAEEKVTELMTRR